MREGQREQQSWGEAEECTAKSKARDQRPSPQMTPKEKRSNWKVSRRVGRGRARREVCLEGLYQNRPAEPSLTSKCMTNKAGQQRGPQ